MYGWFFEYILSFFSSRTNTTTTTSVQCAGVIDGNAAACKAEATATTTTTTSTARQDEKETSSSSSTTTRTSTTTTTTKTARTLSIDDYVLVDSSSEPSTPSTTTTTTTTTKPRLKQRLSKEEAEELYRFCRLCNYVYTVNPTKAKEQFEKEGFSAIVRDIDHSYDRYCILYRYDDMDNNNNNRYQYNHDNNSNQNVNNNNSSSNHHDHHCADNDDRPEDQRPKTQYVVIRGTDNFRNVLLDIEMAEVGITTWSDTPTNLVFHRGFLNVTQCIVDDIKYLNKKDAPDAPSAAGTTTTTAKATTTAESADLPDKQPFDEDENNDTNTETNNNNSKQKKRRVVVLNKHTPIILMGHSLGGACALILAFYLRLKGYNVAKIVTFGQPKVTSDQVLKQIEAYFDGNNVPLVRVVNHLDPIPQLPPSSLPFFRSLRYAHTGIEVYLSSSASASSPCVNDNDKVTVVHSLSPVAREAVAASTVAALKLHQVAEAEAEAEEATKDVKNTNNNSEACGSCCIADGDSNNNNNNNNQCDGTASLHAAGISPVSAAAGAVSSCFSKAQLAMWDLIEELMLVHHHIDLYIANLKQIIDNGAGAGAGADSDADIGDEHAEAD